jgi:hypothetical protein
MKVCFIITGSILFLYFLLILPYSLVLYNLRYNDYNSGICNITNSSIIENDYLYKFDGIFNIKNCSQKLEMCCNNEKYWKEYYNNSTVECYYNSDCDIIPEIYIDTTYSFLQISAFISGIFLGIFLIYYCENKKKTNYTLIN